VKSRERNVRTANAQGCALDFVRRSGPRCPAVVAVMASLVVRVMSTEARESDRTIANDLDLGVRLSELR
jgi:hypothetical protein